MARPLKFGPPKGGWPKLQGSISDLQTGPDGTTITKVNESPKSVASISRGRRKSHMGGPPLK